MARHHPDAYTQQFTASVQRALPGDVVLTTTFLGVKGTHLFRRSYTNLIDPVTGLRPLLQYPSEVDTKYNQGPSNFAALQFNLTRQFHKGFFIAGNYMYAHALDDGSVGAGEADAAENVSCFPCEYGSSDDDVRNSGNLSLVYNLPFGLGTSHLYGGKLLNAAVGGWSVNTLLSARAGLPINVTLSRSASALPDGNNVNQRPDRVAGVPIYLPGRAVHAWLNPAAFAVPAAGTWGDLAKNVITGPPLWQDDSTIEKTFRLTERNRLIFRAEAFNLFNRAQYGQPGSSLNVGSNGAVSIPASFGVITSTVNPAGLVGTGTPRELEFALRITY